MRGKRVVNGEHEMGTGITPADAGKTVIMYSSFNPAKDHPRGCGENCYNVFIVQSRKGSPPRMRGKRVSAYSFAAVSRITPADAGKTL